MRVIRVDDSYDEQLRSLMDMTALGAGDRGIVVESEGSFEIVDLEQDLGTVREQ